MCGIAGYMSKRDEAAPVGRILLDMLTSLASRGPDSAGMALFRSEPGHKDVCWIRLPEAGAPDDHERRIVAGLALVADVGSIKRHLRMTLPAWLPHF
jgi:asparagine synthetase B (glutamine-hydrolysing)